MVIVSGRITSRSDLLARLAVCMARLNFSWRRRMADSERARALAVLGGERVGERQLAAAAVVLAPLVRVGRGDLRRSRCGAGGAARPARPRLGLRLVLVSLGRRRRRAGGAAAGLFLGAAARSRPRPAAGLPPRPGGARLPRARAGGALRLRRGGGRRRRRAGAPRPRAPCEPSSARRRASISLGRRASLQHHAATRSTTGCAACGASCVTGRRRGTRRGGLRREHRSAAVGLARRASTNLRFLVSTTTDFVRPCEKFCRTVPCSMPGRFSVRVFLRVDAQRLVVTRFRIAHSISSAASVRPQSSQALPAQSGEPPRYRSSATMRFISRLPGVARENGSMYHICAAQCQTQFRPPKKV